MIKYYYTIISKKANKYFYASKHWYKNRLRHRENAPAVEWDNGDEEWFFNGKRHRIKGPAMKWTDGREQMWIDGIKLND